MENHQLSGEITSLETTIEIRRQPSADGYAEISINHPGDSISPLAFPGESFSCADRLP